MGFPSKEKLSKALKNLEKVKGTIALKRNANSLERARWDICQKFVKYKMEKEITQKELAKRLGVDEAKVSKILHHRIEEFSTDRLYNLCFKLDPKLELAVG